MNTPNYNKPPTRYLIYPALLIAIVVLCFAILITSNVKTSLTLAGITFIAVLALSLHYKEKLI